MTVSVVMPVRNAARTLPECLQSVSNQSLKQFELIVVDDGSEDNSRELVAAHSRIDQRVRLISAGRIGLVPALNLGVSQARSSLIARMDADDRMHPDRLLCQTKHLENHPELAVSGCLVELFPVDQIRDGYREYARWQNSCVTEEQIVAGLCYESTFAHPSVVFRRSAFDRVGGYRNGPFPEDYDLWIRMAQSGFRMAKVPQALLYWRDSSHRLSRNDARYSREAFDRLRAGYLAWYLQKRNISDVVVWGAGRRTRLHARRIIPPAIRISAWIDIDPRKIGKLLGGRRVHDPGWLHRKPQPFVLVCVTNHGARDEISRTLGALGYRCGQNFLPVG